MPCHQCSPLPRRQFLKAAGFVLTASSLAAAGAGCSAFVYTPQQERLSQESYSMTEAGQLFVRVEAITQLAEVGAAVSIIDPSLPSNLIIARIDKEEYVVAANYCTHRQMALGYEHQKARFYCSSLGGSEFDLAGEPTAGSAEASLKVYETEIQDGSLIITVL